MSISFKLSVYLVFLLGLIHMSSQQPTALIELCRHGSRAPINNTYDPSWSDSDVGELTPVGMRQHYILGTIISSQYPSIFNTTNTPQINILADNFTRCVQTAASQSFGLWNGEGPGLGANYPSVLAIPPYDIVLSEKIALGLGDSAAIPNNFYPPPIFTVNDENVWIFDSYGFCPAILELQAQILEGSEVAQIWELAQPAVQQINSQSSIPINNVVDLMTFGDTLQSNVIVNKPLPGNIQPTQVGLIQNISYFTGLLFYQYFYANQQIINLGAAPLIQEIIQLVDDVVSGTNNFPFTLLSGHDSNVQAFMVAIGYTNMSCLMANYQAYLNGNIIPPYPLCYYPIFASTIKIEIYNTSTPTLKIKYNDVTIPLCGQSGICTVAQFTQIALNGINNTSTAQVIATCQQPLASSKKATVEAFVITENANTNTYGLIQNVLIALFSATSIFLLAKNIKDKRYYEAELERVRGIKMI